MKKHCTYSLDPSITYNPIDELHLDPNSSETKSIIADSLEQYRRFSSKYKNVLHLDKPDSITHVYQAALQENIFQAAEAVRRAFFGHDLHFYGVTYLWDMCMESCVYCPAALENRKKSKYKPLSLSIDEAVNDIQYVMQDGHRHICILTGEDPLRYPPHVLADYIRAFDELGLKEIILNVEPPKNVEDFKLWRDAAKKTALQFRVFQETYNREKYAAIHPVTKYGRKHDFDKRYQSQADALQAGFNNIGLGVLFGNHHYPIEEIDSLQAHANDLKSKTGKYPARVCLPSAKHLEQISVNIPFIIQEKSTYQQFSEIIYALARLAMPTIGLVSSERDESTLLTELDKYATCTTLNVHPGVGDNIKFHENTPNNDIHFEQAPSFSRDPDHFINTHEMKGYHLWLARKENNNEN